MTYKPLKRIIMLRSILLFGLITLQMFAMAMLPTELSDSGIIPKPVSVIPATGIFTLTEKSAIIVPDKSVELMQIGQYLVDKLNPATGFEMLVKSSKGVQSAGNIYLSLSPDDEQLGDEGYQLTINSDVVNLIANKPACLFNGIQTIRQLFPARIEMASKQQCPW